MSKIIQIQNALSEINPAKFQFLCDDYLNLKYGYDVKGLGSMKGKEKTTIGTPDSLILLSNGNFIFVEYTTKTTGVGNKFLEDLEKCFNETKTSINITQIEKVFLCYNTELSTDEIVELRKYCTNQGFNSSNLIFFDINTLAIDIKNYPPLAKEYLNISIDTQQILKPQEFIKNYEKAKFATTLSNKFLFREQELQDIHKLLETNDIILLGGKAGIGKTKLALEVQKQFCEKYPDYKNYCIKNNELNIYEDIMTYFLVDKQYFIIVDDANRLNTQLTHIINLTRRENVRVKLILTVRDYAVDNLERNILREYNFKSYNLPRIEDESIRKMLINEKITNEVYINTIIKISKGNPRLAMMAAKKVVENGHYDTINNVIDIYDNHFNEVLDKLSDVNTQKVLGLLSFFRVVNRNGETLSSLIYELFEIDENTFWNSVEKLYDLELVDLLDTEHTQIAYQMAKIEQTTSTYFFYKFFIEKPILDYAIILDYFLSDFKGKVKDTIIPCYNNFGQQNVLDKISHILDKQFQKLSYDKRETFDFLSIFWIYNPAKTLSFIQKAINALPIVETPILKFEKEKQNSNDDFLDKKIEYPFFGLLTQFYLHHDYFEMALSMLFEYVQKEPELMPEVIKYITTDLTFKSTSSQYNYHKEYTLFKFLFKENESKPNFYTPILLQIANKFLQFIYEDGGVNTEPMTVSIAQISIHPESVQKLRENIWEFLIQNYPTNQEEVFAILKSYLTESYPSMFHFEHRASHTEYWLAIWNIDKPFVFQFFDNLLEPTNFYHCELVHNFLDRLERKKVSTKEYKYLDKKFTNKLFKLSKILIMDWRHYDKTKIKRKDREEYKENKVKNYIKNFNQQQYTEFLQNTQELIILQNGSLDINIIQAFETIFLHLAETNLDFGIEFLKQLLESNLTIYGWGIHKFLQELLKQAPQNFLDFYDYLQLQPNTKYIAFAKISFFELLPETAITDFYLNELINFFQNSIQNLGRINFEKLVKFKVIEPKIVPLLVEIIVNKQKEEKMFLWLFEDKSFFETYLVDFQDNTNLLKDFYFCMHQMRQHFDYDGEILQYLLSNVDENILREYLSLWYSKDENEMNINFIFLWELPNYVKLITDILEVVLQQERYVYYHISSHHFLATLFKGVNAEQIIAFSKSFIEKYAMNENAMYLLFKIITNADQQTNSLPILDFWLQYNKNISVFEQLELVPSMKFGSGSFIPLYEADMYFWESTKPMLIKYKLFEHLEYIDRQIKSCKASMKYDRERDFFSERY